MDLAIGSLRLASAVIQSPMAACTDLPFRLIAREKGLAFSFLEMVSAQALTRGNEKTLGLLKSAPEDRPLGAQLLGGDPAVMAEAAQIIEGLGFDLLDLNLGCPVRKVVSNGEGACLLRDPARAGEIFKAVRRAVKKIPLTVKTRAGFEDESGAEAERIAVMAEAEGFDAVAIHGRTQKQGYVGPAEYSAIARVKRAVKIPVIGNGDVTSAESALRLKKTTGSDGVMIGRGALGNPWIYSIIDGALEGPADSRPSQPISMKERAETLVKHLDLERIHEGERQAVLNSRRIVVWYTAGLPNSKTLRAAVCGMDRLDDVKAAVREFFEALPPDVPSPGASLLLSE